MFRKNHWTNNSRTILGAYPKKGGDAAECRIAAAGEDGSRPRFPLFTEPDL